MIQDLSQFRPVASAWHSTRGDYGGRGCVDLLEPQGRLTGHVRVVYDELGQVTVDMHVEKYDFPQDPAFHPLQLLFGGTQRKEGGRTIIDIGGRPNLTAGFSASLASGELSTSERISYGVILKADGSASLTLRPRRLEYRAKIGRQPRFWILPLINFISDCFHKHPDLDRHPLRIYPTPVIPTGLPTNSKALASVCANEKNRLIIFEYARELGFIELLPDYQERKKALLAGYERGKVMAVMVGAIPLTIVNAYELKSWFPFDFLPILSFALGVEVCAPWVELRDEQGELVARLHSKLGLPSFAVGEAPLHEAYHRGIGNLLTVSQKSKHFGTEYTRVALRNALGGALYISYIDDQLAHLFRAFDALCEAFKLKSSYKLESLLGSSLSKFVDKTIRTAVSQLHSQAKKKLNPSEEKWLGRIARQVEAAKSIKKSYGNSVVTLLKKFELADVEIVDTHLRTSHTGRRQKSFAQYISHYRGVTMHRSYFEFSEGRHKPHELLRLKHHLHDLLSRVLLKMLRYEGTYQPTVIRRLVEKPLDWVTHDTPPSEIGY